MRSGRPSERAATSGSDSGSRRARPTRRGRPGPTRPDREGGVVVAAGAHPPAGVRGRAAGREPEHRDSGDAREREPPAHRGPSVVTRRAASTGSVGPVPYAGHSRASGHAPQAGFLAWQRRRPCQIDMVRQHGPVAPREQARDLGLDLVRVGLLGPAEPAHEPPEVRVDGDPRDAERVAQHDVGRLATDPGQRDEVGEAAGHLAVVPLDQRLAQPDDRGRLGAEEAGRADEVLELLAVGARRRRRRSDSGRTAPGVTRLTRRSVHCAERIVATTSSSGVVKSSSQCASGIGLAEQPVHPSGAPDQCRPGLPRRRGLQERGHPASLRRRSDDAPTRLCPNGDATGAQGFPIPAEVLRGTTSGGRQDEVRGRNRGHHDDRTGQAGRAELAGGPGEGGRGEGTSSRTQGRPGRGPAPGARRGLRRLLARRPARRAPGAHRRGDPRLVLAPDHPGPARRRAERPARARPGRRPAPRASPRPPSYAAASRTSPCTRPTPCPRCRTSPRCGPATSTVRTSSRPPGSSRDLGRAEKELSEFRRDLHRRIDAVTARAHRALSRAAAAGPADPPHRPAAPVPRPLSRPQGRFRPSVSPAFAARGRGIGHTVPCRSPPRPRVRLVQEGPHVDDVLMSAPLFAALDAEAAAALKASMDERRLLKGDVLFAEGDPGDRLYVVTEGKIKLGPRLGRRPRVAARRDGRGRDVRRALAVRPRPAHRHGHRAHRRHRARPRPRRAASVAHRTPRGRRVAAAGARPAAAADERVVGRPDLLRRARPRRQGAARPRRAVRPVAARRPARHARHDAGGARPARRRLAARRSTRRSPTSPRAAGCASSRARSCCSTSSGSSAAPADRTGPVARHLRRRDRPPTAGAQPRSR